MQDLFAGHGRYLVMAAGLSVALSSAGCGGFILRESVDAKQADWRLDPDGPRTVAYARALHNAFAEEAYAEEDEDDRGPELVAQRANEVLAALYAAERGGGPDEPELIAYRGLLLLDLGHNQEGWAELQRSMALAPTLAAADLIVSVWGQKGRNDQVTQACLRTLPAMRDRESRFQLIDLCVKNIDADTEWRALAWAPSEAQSFYLYERDRREAALDRLVPHNRGHR